MIHSISATPTGAVTEHTTRDLPPAIPQPARQITAAESASDANIGDTPHFNLDKALEHLNESMRAWATGMRFDLDEEAQRLVISIIDRESGDVLRTVPSDAVLRVAKMIVQLQGGTVDTRV